MKVLHVYAEGPGLSGIGHHVRQLARHLKRRGVEVTVLASGRQQARDAEPDEEVQVLRVAGWAAPFAMLSPRVLREAGLLPVDLVHLHVPHPAGGTSWLLNLRAVPLVVSWHQDPFRQSTMPLWRPLYRRLHDALLRAAIRIIVPTAIGHVPDPLQAYAEKTSAIPYGIDVAALGDYEPEAVAAFRQVYGTPLLLALGSFGSDRSVRHVLEAVQQTAAGTLLWLGEGPLLALARSLVRERGLIHRVAFLGAVPHRRLVALYHAADLFLVPPEEDEVIAPFVLEAQACGLPVIGPASVPDGGWTMVHEVSGPVVSSSDPSAWSTAVARLLADEGLRERLSAQAREGARGRSHAEDEAERVSAVYRAALGEKG